MIKIFLITWDSATHTIQVGWVPTLLAGFLLYQLVIRVFDVE